MKGVCTPEDWKEWRHQIEYDYAIDNYFHELKNMEIMRDRITLMRDMEEYVGKYYSHEYARRFILQQTENDMKEIDEQIKTEKGDPRYSEDEEMDSDEIDIDSLDQPQPDEREQDQEKEEN